MTSTCKAIFITGGGSGIGRATARHFAGKGWMVGLADVNEAGMAETAAMLPAGLSSCHKLDVRDRAAWDVALSDFAAKTGGRIDILFNNAGIAAGGPIDVAKPDDIERLFDINLLGVFWGAQAALPYLKAAGPGAALVNTSSAAGLYAGPGMSAYSATKFGVRAITESLDQEWREHGIKVRAIMPGFIDTPLLMGTSSGSNRTIRESVQEAGLEFTPVERVAEAVWDAAHNAKRLFWPVGKTAKRLAFLSRWAPGLLRRGGLFGRDAASD